MGDSEISKKTEPEAFFLPEMGRIRACEGENGSFWADKISEGELLYFFPAAVAVFDGDLNISYLNKLAGEWLKRDGKLNQILDVCTDCRIFGQWSGTLKAVIGTGESVSFSAVSFQRGDEKKTVNLRCVPAGKRGSGLGILIVEDITDRFAADTELAQNERLAALGRIAGKVAHELNNPMDGILRYIGLAGRAVDSANPAKSKEYLEHCRRGLLRMAGIITQLLQFSRTTYGTNEAAPITKILADAVKSLERHRGHVQVETVAQLEAEPVVRAGNLYQVFCNIIKNAFDAMEGRGKLTISAESEGGFLKISFVDTGPGLPVDGRESIFKPFFTTKAAGKGTGLGLCVCKELIQNLSGEILADNNPDGGSKFTVVLPVARISVE